MDPITVGLILGGVSALGGIFQNQQAAAASDKQMAFQKETLQHQYQWAMADMKRAGLNPILAYKQGGAGSAGGSSYSPVNIGEAFSRGAQTGVSSASQAKQLEAAIDNVNADTLLKHEQQNTQTAMQTQARASAMASSAQAAQAGAQTRILDLTLQSAKAAAAQAKIDEDFYKSDAGQMLQILNKIGISVNPFFDATSTINKGVTGR